MNAIHKLNAEVKHQHEHIKETKNKTKEEKLMKRLFKEYCIQELYPHSFFAEEVRKLRTNFAFILKDKSARLVEVTSPEDRNGKTTVSINLAISLAHYGKKVLLVDSNLRNPILSSIFFGKDKHQMPGLTDALLNELNIKDIIRPTSINKLDIIATGTHLLSARELFGSKQMKFFTGMLKATDYDYIIFDGPSMKFADSVLLSKQVDGIVLVLQHNKTKKEALNTACRQLNALHANVFGIIVNKFEE